MQRILTWTLVAALLLLSGCHAAGNAPLPSRDAQPTQPFPTERTEPVQPDDASTVGQLKGPAETREDAEETAALYGIELVDFQNGLALYYTEEDPKEVIRRGEENGWPQLSLNRTAQLY